jgi:hypothetical protein
MVFQRRRSLSILTRVTIDNQGFPPLYAPVLPPQIHDEVDLDQRGGSSSGVLQPRIALGPSLASLRSRMLTATLMTTSDPRAAIVLMVIKSSESGAPAESKSMKTRVRKKGLKDEISAGDWRNWGRVG